MASEERRAYPVRYGEGTFWIYWTDRSLYIIDSLTNTAIRIFYNPWVKRWYAMLTDPQGNFVHSLRYISVCATAVYEYCARSYTSGNLYLDVLYCEPVEIDELNYWTPAEFILAAYKMGDRREYYRWLRAILPEVAKYLGRRLVESAEAAESYVLEIFTVWYHLEPEYVGFFATGYKYCARILYGVQCRMEPPPKCDITTCSPLCYTYAFSEAPECDIERIHACQQLQPVWKPIAPREYPYEKGYA